MTTKSKTIIEAELILARNIDKQLQDALAEGLRCQKEVVADIEKYRKGYVEVLETATEIEKIAIIAGNAIMETTFKSMESQMIKRIDELLAKVKISNARVEKLEAQL